MCHNELKLKLDVHLFGELNLNLNFRKLNPLSIVDLGRPIIKTGVEITILRFHQQVKTELRF